MIIQYIPEHKWLEPVKEDPLSEMGKSNRARLRSTINNMSTDVITHSFEPLTQEILQWFTPLYTERITNKKNPKVFDIYSTTIGKQSPYPYFALILREHGEPIGATIFSQRKKIISIAYRIYPNNWAEGSLQANPSLYTEYLINKYAYTNGFETISHGRDRNPYGPNSHIGLAIFKLSIGCKAYLPAIIPPIEQFDTDKAQCDTLIFSYPEEGSQITKGYLICTEDKVEHYQQVTKYNDQIAIETIIRKQADLEA